MIVEIDEIFFVKKKYELGRWLSSVWLFGEIERVTKKKFIVPLVVEKQDRSAATLIPLIKKYILPGTIIVNDDWKAYCSLGNEGYTYWVINHTKHFVDPENRDIHTQNIEKLWREKKEWTKGPGIRSEYFEQYFAHYLFTNTVTTISLWLLLASTCRNQHDSLLDGMRRLFFLRKLSSSLRD